MITLFDDQQQAVDAVRASMAAGHKRVLMQAATGSGKTVMASYILRAARERGSNTWFVVPRKELLRQTSKTYDKFDIPHSYIASGMGYNAMADSHIASLQTLPRRLDKLAPPQMVVIDECHFGDGYMNNLFEWFKQHGVWVIGLSATPKKQNGQGMDKWYDDLVLGTPIKELIALGRLSKYEMYAPSVPDLSDIKTTAGDYNKSALQKFMDNHGQYMIGDAVKTYKDNAAGMRGITFCTSVKESKRTAEAYREAGVNAMHMDGTMSSDVRREIILQFADGRIDQITSVDLMTFGFDLSAQVDRDITIECMSDLRPTKSESLQLQKWGRVLRAKDKPALIFDHAGNAHQHGMPDSDREWSLQGREKRRRSHSEREVDMKQCTECFFCHPPAPNCPKCGFIYPIQSREVEQLEGELVKITENDIKKKKRMEVGKARSRADLEAIARERGYKQGWVYKMMKLKGIR